MSSVLIKGTVSFYVCLFQTAEHTSICCGSFFLKVFAGFFYYMGQCDITAMAYLMPGLRKGTVLVYNGYRYHKNKSTKIKIYWRCWRKECKGTLTTSLFDTTLERPDIEVISVSTTKLTSYFFVYMNFFFMKTIPYPYF